MTDKPVFGQAPERYSRDWAANLLLSLRTWFQKLDGNFELTGRLYTHGVRRGVVTVTAATYTASLDDHWILVNRSGAVTITLPDFASGDMPGKEWVVQDISGNASSNNITIDTAGSSTFNGGASSTISSDYGRQTVIWSGTEYLVA